MDKISFLNKLKSALTTEQLSEQEIAEHVRYYEDYIEREVRNGRNENDVLDELGDPRLICKSILSAKSFNNSSDGYRQSNYTNENTDRQSSYENSNEKRTGKFSKAKFYLILALIVIAIITIIVGIFSIIWAALPVILVAMIAIFLYNLFTKK